MQSIKKILFILFMALSCGVYSSNSYAQEVVVGVRPPIPHYERIAALVQDMYG